MRLKATFTVAGSPHATQTIVWDGAMGIQTVRETPDIMVSVPCLKLSAKTVLEGIISTPIPGKWRRGRSIGTCTNGIRDHLAMRNSIELESDLSKDSVNVWSSLPINYYRQEKEPYAFYAKGSCANEYPWDFTESPSSPKDAFRETCEFYGGPYLSREWSSSAKEFPKSQEEKRKKQASPHYRPISRSKSLHNLEYPNTPIYESRQETITFGLSEQDLDRARSVLGLPTKGCFKRCMSQSIYRGPRQDLSGNIINLSGSRIFSRPYSSDLDLGYGSQSVSRPESMNVSSNYNNSRPTKVVETLC